MTNNEKKEWYQFAALLVMIYGAFLGGLLCLILVYLAFLANWNIILALIVCGGIPAMIISILFSRWGESLLKKRDNVGK